MPLSAAAQEAIAKAKARAAKVGLTSEWGAQQKTCVDLLIPIQSNEILLILLI